MHTAHVLQSTLNVTLVFCGTLGFLILFNSLFRCINLIDTPITGKIYVMLCATPSPFHLKKVYFNQAPILFQMVYVSISASRPPRSKSGEGLPVCYLPAPYREKIPMLLLLRESASNNLFSMLKLLSDFQPDPALDKQVRYSWSCPNLAYRYMKIILKGI